MSGETEQAVSGWTVDTLRYHLAQRVDYERQISDERDRRYDERWRAQESAREYAQEKSNEFRGALDDLSKRMATKDQHAALLDQVVELRSRLDVGNPAVFALQQQQASAVGQRRGSDLTMGKIYAAIGALGVVLSIVVLLANNVIK